MPLIPTHARNGVRFTPQLRQLDLERVVYRVPDRNKRSFDGRGNRRIRLTPAGRPNDVYSDLLVTLPRVRWLEGQG